MQSNDSIIILEDESDLQNSEHPFGSVQEKNVINLLDDDLESPLVLRKGKMNPKNGDDSIREDRILKEKTNTIGKPVESSRVIQKTRRRNIVLDEDLSDEEGSKKLPKVEDKVKPTTTEIILSKIHEGFDIEGEEEPFVVEKKEQSAKKFVIPARGDWIFNEKIRLPSEVGRSLYDYQVEGVEFLLSSWNSICGGSILADDMGMGKTRQVCAALCAICHSGLANKTLIVIPLSIYKQWRENLEKWVRPYMKNGYIEWFHGNKKEEIFRRVRRDGGILLTTYETCEKNVNMLKTISWDCLIADEATKIKNFKTGIFKALRILADHSIRRVSLTGTPFENSLSELWTLFDFTCAGKLLGEHSDFKKHFAGKIESSQYMGTTEGVIGLQLSKALKDIISPFLLRREKSLLQRRQEPIGSKVNHEKEKDDVMHESDDICDEKFASAEPKLAVTKTDCIVWINLSNSQRLLYKAFLESQEVKDALNKTQSPLAAITVLKKICDDTRLVSEEIMKNPSVAGLRQEILKSKSTSGKLIVLTSLLMELCQLGGHKVLVFSHSKRMLDLIESQIKNEIREFSYLRIDGDLKVGKCWIIIFWKFAATNNIKADRTNIVRAFNRDEPVGNNDNFQDRWDCLLLTSGVGALGIDITGADRVVIFDPHWNPALDDQAVDRAFRIGQKNNVVCYRFVSAGTVEEKMTRIQVRKTSLARKVLNNEAQRSYSSLVELKDLFSLSDEFAEDSLYHIFKNTSDIGQSVRQAMKGHSDTEEICSQLLALSGEGSFATSLSQLHENKVVLGVTNRSVLFSSEDTELKETLKGLSKEELQEMSKTLEDAREWVDVRRQEKKA